MRKCRKVLSILIVLIIITSFTFTSVGNAVNLATYKTVDEDKTVENFMEEDLVEYETLEEVGLRKTNDLNSEIILLIEKNSVLIELELMDNDFIKVEYEEEVGYIHKEDLKRLTEETMVEDTLEVESEEKTDPEEKEVAEEEGSEEEVEGSELETEETQVVESEPSTEEESQEVEAGNLEKEETNASGTYSNDLTASRPNGMTYRTIKKLHLRSGNSDTSKSLTVMEKGSLVKHLGTTDNDWFKLEYKGRVGYAHRKNVTSQDNYDKNYSSGIEVSDSNGMTYRTIRELDLRDGNSNNYRSLALMAKGSLVSHLGTASNDWFKLEYNGKVGYVHRRDVTSQTNYDRNYAIEVSDSNGMTYRTIKDLSLREGNSNNHKSLTTMAKGSLVKHLGTADNDWFKLEYNGRVGYAHRTDVTSQANYDKNYAIEVSKPNGRTYRTIKDLHLREGNSENYKSLALMEKGSLVKHLGTADNDWFKLEYKGKVGYAHRSEVTSQANYDKNYRDQADKEETENPQENEDEKDDTEATDPNSIRSTTITDLNMRTGPSVSYPVIENIPPGAEVIILSIYNSSGWGKVKYRGREGFVNVQYLRNIRTGISRSDDVKIKESNISSDRQNLVNTSLSLVDKVPYFWGGKTYSTGWNSHWNVYKKVTSTGISDYGKYLPFGLDCSGFVDWAYRSAGLGNVFSGGGTSYQWNSSYSIFRSQALPGDVVFKNSPGSGGVNHIGIYVGDNEDGEALVVHSSYSRKGVVLTKLRNSGLVYFRRAKDTF